MIVKLGCSIALVLGLSGAAIAQTVFVDQGDDWTPDLRERYYTQDQGARIMPLTWMRALKASDNQPFLHDALDRYGYLPMPGRGEPDLPVGFTTNDYNGTTAIGMTCAACHTRQIDVNGTGYRIDGGPAISDFQNFLKDLDDAVLAVLESDESFGEFAEAILGAGASDSDIASLKTEVEAWSDRFHTLITRSLPDPAWGPARLDAVSMIFNRLAGLDIGPEADNFLIPDNIAVADAPTRYPFLWNAARQDHTQWPGFAANGNDLLGLSRNLGEVYGVFAYFRPEHKPGHLFEYDYISHNSANFDGLKALEDWIWDIGAPKWPWSLDRKLAAQGEEIFNLSTELGGCVDCHGKKRGEIRSVTHTTYATPIKDVGTDTRECRVLTRVVQTGVLEGASIPLFGKPLGAQAPAIDVLAISVIGGIIQDYTSSRSVQADADAGEALSMDQDTLPPNYLDEFEDLRGAFPAQSDNLTTGSAAPQPCKYEARVLDGIWAAAPYMHNGSVPTLVELLKSPDDRIASFMPGPNYDIENVGMAVDQTKFDHVIQTTGCDDLDSGNSRCGHDYGTSLTEDHKRALLEYLKSI